MIARILLALLIAATTTSAGEPADEGSAERKSVRRIPLAAHAGGSGDGLDAAGGTGAEAVDFFDRRASVARDLGIGK
jgi:hypothetical protein